MSAPRYLVLRVRRPGLWPAARAAVLLAFGALVAALLARPATGLLVLWGIVVPLLPLVWLVAPGLWRNVCPMATANQLPRWLGLSSAKRLPGWLQRHGYGIGAGLFLVAITLRPGLLVTSGAASAVLLVLAPLAALAMGARFAGKSGFCGAICPLRPSQDLLARAPVVRVAHAHCTPCVGCSSSCQDAKPRTAHVEQLEAADPWRRAFAGALPAITWTCFTATPGMAIGHHAFRLVVVGLAGIGLLHLVEGAGRLPAGRVTALFTAAAFAIFYVFNVPVLAGSVETLTGAVAPAWLVWQLIGATTLLALRWLVQAWRVDAPAPPVALPVVPVPDPADRRRPAAPPAPARPVALPVVVGRPPVVVPDRRATPSLSGAPVVTLWPGGEQVEVEVGTSLADAARAAGHELPEGCGTGLCGCDPVRVRSGAGALSAPGDDERATLERLDLPAGTRLACSARVTGDVAVDLEVAQGDARTVAPPAVVAERTVERVVVVGNGVAGVTAASQVRRLAPHARVDLVTDSLRPFYNRIAVARLIHEAVAPDLALMPPQWYAAQRIEQWLGTPVAGLDLASRHVVLGGGQTLPYDRLVLATGARSLALPVPGADLPGVFGLRSADDAAGLRAHVDAHRPRRAVVIGGGVLGVEAADALVRLGVHTTVIERAGWLCAAEVDRRAGVLLRDALTARGVDVLVEQAVTAVHGEVGPTAVALQSGALVAADVVVVCAGVTPNAELARGAGLAVGRGVLVDERMQTSDPAVLACGDVAELAGATYGRWPVAVEQATVAAVRALGGERPYSPGPVPTKLKVTGVQLRVVGASSAGPGQHEVVRDDRVAGTYRKLVVGEDGRLAGALAFGEVPDWDALVAAVRDGADAAVAAQLVKLPV